MRPPVTACIPAEWMFHRYPHRELTQDDTELILKYKLFYSGGANQRWSASEKNRGKQGTKAATNSANIAASRRGGSQDHYLQGLNFLFWHARYIPQKGILQTWGQRWSLEWLSTSILCTVTWAYTQSLLQKMQEPSIYCLLSASFTLRFHEGSVLRHKSRSDIQ